MLSKSFEVGEKVVIGVTSDSLARREGKSPEESYAQRVRELESAIRTSFPGREFVISKLDDYFGQGIASPEVEAIVVTRETASRVSIANSLRAQKGLGPLEVVVVDYVLADDMKPISSTRIRRGEVDPDGHLINKKVT